MATMEKPPANRPWAVLRRGNLLDIDGCDRWRQFSALLDSGWLAGQVPIAAALAN